MAELIPPPDAALNLLIRLGLTDDEQYFRGFLDAIAKDSDNPKPNELTIAALAVLMGKAGIGLPVVMKTTKALTSRSDDELKEDAVAIINGMFLAVPDSKAGALVYDINTMRIVSKSPKAISTTVWSLAPIWDLATGQQEAE
jgi:hypothetical protein